MEVTMSVHEALARLKLLDKKIYQVRTNRTQVMAVIRNSDKTIDGVTLADFESTAKGTLQSFEAMLENYARLKSAIVLSNATTKVKICGKEYTVAEAIERKSLMKDKEAWASILSTQYENIVRMQKEKEESFQIGFERFLSSQGDAKNRKAEEIEVLRKFYSDNNGTHIFDPCNLSNVINKMVEEYEAFKTEVDFRLSESNAMTKITVDFVD